MQLTARHVFEASCDRVFAMVTDPSFLLQACRDLGALSETIRVEPTDVGAITDVEADVEVPGPLATFAGPTSRVVERMEWGPADADGARSARFSIKVVGLPVTVDAVARLAPIPGGCAVDYEGTLAVKVPLIGPVIEKQAAPFVLETLDVQQQTGNAWLASH
ncbi:MAG TPA: DUF2505 domain-containing protein [Propioniciclava tarda]|nr:DUF2505 domain-containing protein [Propioniciclava tarda]